MPKEGGVSELVATKKKKEVEGRRNGSGGRGACDDINLNRTYRPLLYRPQGLTWRACDEEIGVDVDDGENAEIELTFILPLGGFATMRVREVLESDAEKRRTGRKEGEEMRASNNKQE